MVDLSPEHVGVLTDDEAESLILLFAKYRGEEGFTEDELYEVLKEFNGLKVDAIMFAGVLAEDYAFNLRDDGKVIYFLTKEMLERVREDHDQELSALLDGTLELEGDAFRERESNGE